MTQIFRKILFFVSPHGDALSTGIAVNDNNWHRATATFNGITWKLYLDGYLKGAKNMLTNVVKTGSAKIGGADSLYWNGNLDSIYVWNRELSEVEVEQIDVNDVYKIKVGESLTVQSPCELGNTTPVIINPGPADGGTIQTISFDCEGIKKEIKVIIFRDFSKLIKFPGNGAPAIPFNSHSWNRYGQDTVYFTDELKRDGRYYALSNTNDSSLGTWDKLTLYSSVDFLNWTAESTNPVIMPTIGSWDEVYLLHPAVIKIAGLWYAYYSAYGYGARNYWNNNPGDSRLGVEHIDYAVSSDLIHWQKNSNPVLGSPSSHAALPSIVKIPAGYRMYYYDRLNNNSRYAESSDGINWVDHGVFFSKQIGDWDYSFNMNNFDPWVVKNPRGFFEMTYSVLYSTSNYLAGWTQDVGYAVSEDGINWYKYQGPIITGTRRAGDFDQWYIGNPMLYFNSNKLYLYYAGIKEDSVVSNGIGQGGVAYLNIDSLIDVFSLRTFLSQFTSIFDYTNLVVNYGL